MMDAEDFGAEQAAAQRMCGWNGSLALWAPENRVADPMPQWVRDRLATAREVALSRHRLAKARGQCL